MAATLACAFVASLSGPAAAEQAAAPQPKGADLSADLSDNKSKILVELFTSQGCVSCPPADGFFATLAEDSRVIALSLHVDYWDYIGWEDSFGNSDFTERQKSYARAIGSRTIYTPQFIIDGVERIEGFDPEKTLAALTAKQGAPSPVQLSVSRIGGDLVIRAEADPPLSAPVRLELVRYMPQATVSIERGENAGKTVTYRNIVTSWQTLGDWSGTAPLELTVPAGDAAPAVAIVQDVDAGSGGPGQILAAVSAD
ncbi:DUF1223 domain-containing protein [Xinfangfangia sp. D13-10-4-6]|nr:DUF1223 domain-containing protein [Pseudogemmobacter hezensis]